MNDTVDIDAAFDELRDRIIVPVFEQAASDMVDEMREMISVPVEYIAGPRGGIIVIRSSPGEAPRRETGDLWASIQFMVIAPRGVFMVVFTDVEYSLYLEQGTDRMDPRPHWSTLLQIWQEILPMRLTIAIRSGPQV